MSADAAERADVVVVGAGLAGLAAAWHLRDRRVVVLEAGERVGGRLCSEPRGDLWLNFGAHVFGAATSPAGRLIEALSLDARPAPGRLAAAEMRGRLAASGPAELLPFQLPLSTRDRLALLRVGARLRLAVRRYGALAKPQPGDDFEARQRRLLSFMDDRSMADFLGPLPPDVDALFRCTLRRSSGEPEDLQAGYGVGYFHLVWDRAGGLSRNLVGGSATLTDALAAALPEPVRPRRPVVAVRDTGEAVEVVYEEQGGRRTLVAGAAVVATEAPTTRTIVDGLHDDTRAALAEIPYGPYVVVSVRTDEERAMPWDGIYALAAPHRSFTMLMNTTNTVRSTEHPRGRGSSLMAYAAGELAHRQLDDDDATIEQRFVDDLVSIFPAAKGQVVEVVVKRWERGLPYPRPGRARLQEALTRPHARIHLAGDYLGTNYTDTAVWTGEVAAQRARATLSSPKTPLDGDRVGRA